jgi:hypothetical protein
MAVFISASDEHSGGDGSTFLFGGYIGPEKDWSEFFVPAWQQRVLDSPPKIPYLHMTEIRSREFRDEWGLSELAADDRVDEAISIVETMGSFYPIMVEMDAAYVKNAFAEIKVRRAEAKQFEAKRYEPDYLSFVAYAHTVLDYVHKKHAHVDKVDFIVERKGNITRYIQEFHDGLAGALTSIGRSELSSLVGDLIPAGKDRIPCQAADLLCWYAGRFENAQEVKPEDEADARRYLKLRNRKGLWFHLPHDLLSELAAGLDALSRRLNSSAESQ